MKVSKNVVAFIVLLCSCNQPKDDALIEGRYFGQEPPGERAVIFAPNILSGDLHEDGAPYFSQDGNEVYWRITNNPQSIIACMKQVDGSWSKPEIVPFIGKYSAGRMFLTPDGSKLYFSANIPLRQDVDPENDFNFWVVERIGTSWSDPVALDATINSEHTELDIAVTNSGTIYFHREGSPENEFDILRSKLVAGKYTESQPLPYPVNTESIEAAPYVAPDESYMIYTADRPENIGEGDLYISFRSDDDTWSEPKNLGDGVNTEYDEKFASVSADGKYLFFVSTRPRTHQWSFDQKKWSFKELDEIMHFYYKPKWRPYFGDIYWIDAESILKRK